MKSRSALLHFKPRLQSGWFWSFLFLLPALCIYIVFLFLPLVQTIQLSFTDWNGLSPDMHYIGLSNYKDILSDERFLWSLIRTLAFVGMHLVLGVFGGLIMAVFISQVRWGQSLFRLMLFIPHILSLAVVGILWTQIFNPQFGLLNTMLKAVHLDSLIHPWLGDKLTVLPSIGVASGWHAFGLYMVIFVAGIQMIDKHLYEAAYMDGASSWKKFWHVTVPGLHNTMSFVLTIAIISGLKGFGTVWAMTRGGPVNHSELAVVYIWRSAFEQGELGKSMAGSIIFGIIVILFTVFFNQLRDRKGRM